MGRLLLRIWDSARVTQSRTMARKKVPLLIIRVIYIGASMEHLKLHMTLTLRQACVDCILKNRIITETGRPILTIL